MKQAAIAAVLRRDLLPEDKAPKIATVKCFMCGLGMVYRGSRFCSQRCRDYYDDGAPGFAQDWLQPKINYGMRMGPHGFYIHCANCQKEFESKGLRCCSVSCERQLGERDVEAAPRRRCAQCGVRIPTWRKGRRVSKATRFCSSKCSKKAKRQSDSLDPFLGIETMK
jgi:hypothetical protein